MSKLTATDWIWRDGEFIRWDDAQIHVLSHSVQFGSSVFEGIRCYSTARGPAIFRLQDHLQRMIDSAKIYRMDLAYSLDDLVEACCELVERNELDACYLRPMIVRGYGAMSMVPFASPVHVYLPCWPWGTYLGEGALENGVDACVANLGVHRGVADHGRLFGHRANRAMYFGWRAFPHRHGGFGHARRGPNG